MAYNKKFLLQRIIEIQNIVLAEKGRGRSQVWVYHNIIAQKYLISEGSFNRYMGINAKAELRELLEQECEKWKRGQVDLFFV